MEKGVLLVAHGSRILNWRGGIFELYKKLQIVYPVVIGFLDGVGEEGIQGALLRLKESGVKQVLVIPLFVCSGSSHIEEIRSLLRFGEGKRVSRWEEMILYWEEPLNDHPLVIEILKERIQNMSKNLEEEVLMLVAHGSRVREKQDIWEAMVARIAFQLKKEFGFKGVTYATIHPNTLKRRARMVSRKHSLLILPLFLCEGYYTNTFIPEQLAGITYRYDQRPYFPHPNGVRWIKELIDYWVKAV